MVRTIGVLVEHGALSLACLVTTLATTYALDRAVVLAKRPKSGVDIEVFRVGALCWSVAEMSWQVALLFLWFCGGVRGQVTRRGPVHKGQFSCLPSHGKDLPFLLQLLHTALLLNLLLLRFLFRDETELLVSLRGRVEALTLLVSTQ